MNQNDIGYNSGTQKAPAYNAGSQPVYIIQQQQSSGTSTALILFIVGFFCTPCWWIGSCLSVANNDDRTWRLANRVMTTLSVIGIIVGIVIYAVTFNTILKVATSGNS